ncbi:zinc finger BED domain-containing protein DAYSLEEPER-like [Papaver somniferum]|uniref:zinc finger BED domain-containing protein DAYSLEEPER-like n=1 Tax=Papaver somniferum TaxID=3469 RepID=UPI000E700B2E|nr:zinc finger BED domain-containing protein DAYSLEEPER-like [Papaver somniferum]XP_026395277.1 zinc finger BED domain-containing protein DAYSLEEPER-like [Papaver somniferum]
MASTLENTETTENITETAENNEIKEDNEINENTEINENNGLQLETENNGLQLVTADAQPSKRRRKKSVVWEHFTVENVSAGCTRALCKQCKQSFAYSNGSKFAGTSHLKRHIAQGTCLRRREGRNTPHTQLTPYTPENGVSGSASIPSRKRRRGSSFTPVPFDPDVPRQEIAKMIIMNDYPLHMVEHPTFASFIRTLQPQFNMGNFSTVQGDCVALYLREKQNLVKLLEGLPGKISLTVDMYMSNQTLGYVFLTGHFIDKNWKLHRRILNVVMVPSPHSGDALSHAIGVCLGDWGLENKLFSITLKKSMSSDTNTASLRGYLSIKNPLILKGQLLIEHCYAHVLSSMATDALNSKQEVISKVRESVKYVKTSMIHDEMFMELKEQLQVPSSKDLILDDKTQWNTTYLMLVAAMELREVFSCLDTADPDYKIEPSTDEWKQIETLCVYLRLFYNAANMLTGTSYPTSNLYFHEVWKVHLELSHASNSEDPSISNLTRPLKEKIDKYWNMCFLVLAFTVAMDPRFKMKLVEFSFQKIYGEDSANHLRIVDDGIHELFSEYEMQPSVPLTANDEHDGGEMVKTEEGMQVTSGGPLLSCEDDLLDFDMFISEMSSTQQTKSELDQYLEESLLPRAMDFDILSWWKINHLKYPILSRMARDILSIPVSSVPPESVFFTGIKELDQYRSSLRPETVESLICAKDWLKYAASPETVVTSNALVKMEI